jgi:hypothetical protein
MNRAVTSQALDGDLLSMICPHEDISKTTGEYRVSIRNVYVLNIKLRWKLSASGG